MPLSGPPREKPVDIADLLRAGLDRHPDAVALLSAKTRSTWRELETAANRLGANPDASYATLRQHAHALFDNLATVGLVRLRAARRRRR